MKSIIKSKTSLILITICILLVFSPLFSRNLKLNSNIRDKGDIKLLVMSGNIHIDNNWTAAKSAGICTGEGTTSNPYLIKNLEIDGRGTGICILIENSDVYFAIKNCIIYNSGDSDQGIRLFDVDNGKITDNKVSNCGVAISLSSTFFTSSNNIILRNKLNENGVGIELYAVSSNEVTGNTINNNEFGGIYLSYGDYNIISENIISNNAYGIGFYANYVYKSEYNIITNNLVKNNTNFGIYLPSHVDLNEIFLNCFIDNNAYDDGLNNQWDNGIKGNYWSDYKGSDSNNDGIGDSVYEIDGPAGSIDNFPLIKCPISTGFPILLIVLITTISGGAVLGVVAFLLIRRKRKRIE